MAVALPFIALAAELGTTAYSVNESRQQARESRDAARDQENAQLAMQQELQQQQAQQNNQAEQQQQQAVQRQRAIASGYQQASQTQFTSPLGLPGGGASTTRGSLLGY